MPAQEIATTDGNKYVVIFENVNTCMLLAGWEVRKGTEKLRKQAETSEKLRC